MTEHNHHEHDHEHDYLEGHEGHEHITIIDEEGNEILHEVLFTFESDDFNKSYVLCYPAGIPEADIKAALDKLPLLKRSPPIAI